MYNDESENHTVCRVYPFYISRRSDAKAFCDGSRNFSVRLMEMIFVKLCDKSTRNSTLGILVRNLHRISFKYQSDVLRISCVDGNDKCAVFVLKRVPFP